MDLWSRYKLELTPYLIIIFLVFWTLFIYIIGSLHYQCECERANMIATFNLEEYKECIDQLNQPVIIENNVTFYSFDEEGNMLKVER